MARRAGGVMTMHAEEALAEIATMAATNGWHEVTGFLATLRSEPDALSVFADGDQTRFVEWVGTPAVVRRDLAEVAQDPAAMLETARSITLLRAGEPITTQVLAVLTAQRALADGASMVVVDVTGVVDEAELDEAARRVWRVLVAEPGERWTGVDLAPHGVLLWRADPGAGKVGSDVDALRAWLGNPGDTLAAMFLARARYALELAESACAAAVFPTSTESRNPVAAVAAVRSRLLQRLDQDTDLLQARCAEAIRDLESELHRAVSRAEGRDPVDVVRAALTDRAADWEHRVRQAAAEQVARTVADARTILSELDWTTLGPATGQRPDTVLAAYGAVEPVDRPTPAAMPTGTRRAAAEVSPTRLLLVSAVTAKVVGASAKVVGATAGPAASIGAGLITAALFEKVLATIATEQRNRAGYARAVESIGALARSFDEQVGARVTQWRRTTEAVLTNVCDDLVRALPPAETAATADPPCAARLREVRAALPTA